MKQTERYLALAQKKTPAADAIRQAYGMEPKQLDDELRSFFRTGRVPVYRYKVPDAARNLHMTSELVAAIDARARVAELKLQMQDHFEQAVNEFEQILQNKPDQPIALRGLAYAALQKGDKHKAADYFHRAATLDVPDAHIYYLSAALLFQINEDKNPEEHMAEIQSYAKKAIDLDPNLGPAYTLLGITYSWQRNFADAVKAEAKALELNPRDEAAALNLANYYMAAEQTAPAIDLAQKLTNSSRPEIAEAAVDLLQRIQTYQDEVRQKAVARQDMENRIREIHAGAVNGPAPGGAVGTKGDAAVPATAIIEGKLSSVQCLAGGGANFEIDTGTITYVLVASDVHAVKFSGGEFSCTARDRKVRAWFKREERGNVPLVIDFE